MINVAAGPELAAAVTNARGLGVIGCPCARESGRVSAGRPARLRSRAAPPTAVTVRPIVALPVRVAR